MIKKSLAWILVLCMVLSNVTGVLATTQNGNVTVRVEGYDSTFMQPTTVGIEAFDLSNYNAQSGTGDEPNAFHALIRAFEQNGMDTNDSDTMVQTNGYFTSVCGLNVDGQSGFMYTVNNEIPMAGITGQTIKVDDEIVLYYIKDWSLCQYSYFDKNKVTINKGTSTTLNLKHIVTDMVTWENSAENCEGADITINNQDTNYVTDYNGNVTMTFDEEGTYYISAEKYAGETNTLSRAYCKVEVLDDQTNSNLLSALNNDLFPEFDSENLSYDLELPSETAAISLYPKTQSQTAVVTAVASWDAGNVRQLSNNGELYNLTNIPVGESTFEITVTHNNEIQPKTYVININRLKAENALLSALKIESGTVDAELKTSTQTKEGTLIQCSIDEHQNIIVTENKELDNSIFIYSTDVNYYVNKINIKGEILLTPITQGLITITNKTNNSSAQVKSSELSSFINLEAGKNELELVVSSPCANNDITYTLFVNRLPEVALTSVQIENAHDIVFKPGLTEISAKVDPSSFKSNVTLSATDGAVITYDNQNIVADTSFEVNTFNIPKDIFVTKDNVTTKYTLIINQSTDNLDEINSILDACYDKFKNTYTGWEVMDMALYNGGEDVDEIAFLSSVRNELQNSNLVTSIERNCIALSALKYDASALHDGNNNKINAINKIANMDNLDNLNGYVYGLLAYDSGEYEIINADSSVPNWTREKIIQQILMSQLSDGSWSLADTGSIDITAIVISALAPYYDTQDVKTAVNKAITWLSQKQTNNGGFIEYGQENSNSASMVLIALTSLGIDPQTNLNFIKGENSIIDSLLSFKTADKLFGFSNNLQYNSFATEQGFRALVSYKKFIDQGKTPFYTYQFGKPNKDGSEEVTVSQLRLVSEPTKKVYQINDSFDITGAQLEATLSDKSVIVVENEKVGVIGFDSETSGTKSIKLTYGGLTSEPFDITIQRSGNGGGGTLEKKAYISVRDPKGTIYLSKRMVTIEDNETALSILQKTDLSVVVDTKTQYGTYVEGIEGLSEFDEGPKSGWMYKVNGELCKMSSGYYKIKSGDYVEWLYSRELGDDLVSGGTSYSSGNISKSINLNKTLKDGELTLKSSELKNADSLTVSGDVSLVFDYKALGQIGLNNDLKIKIEKADKSLISENISDIIGDRPIYNITLESGNKVISDFKDGSVKISIPYVLSNDEKPENLVVYYINDEGAGEKVQTSSYNASLKAVEFTTNHFSKYCIGYLNDEIKYPEIVGWAKPYIFYLIEKGTIDNKYINPDESITRADFVELLAKMSKEDLSRYNDAVFKDVSEKDTYFNSVNWAYKNEIVKGFEGNFSPFDKISRQDMVVIITRYAKVNKIELPVTVDKINFKDKEQISDYATESVNMLQTAGIISGNEEGNFEPLNNTTLGEAAKMTAVLLQLVENK